MAAQESKVRMMKALMFCLIVFSPAFADVKLHSVASTGGSKFSVVIEGGQIISEHNTDHKAWESAMFWLQDNCNENTCTAFIRQTFELRVVVKNDNPLEPGQLTITWDPPQFDTLQKKLAEGDIAGYNLYLNETLHWVPQQGGLSNQQLWKSGPLPNGEYNIKVQAVGNHKSDWSDVFIYTKTR